MFGLIRIYFNILPFTPDGLYYVDDFFRIELFGPGLYERFIYFINIFFGVNVNIIILINIIFYCLSIKELILLIPDYKNKNFSLFFIFAFFLPSVIWFIPNILRESIFIFFIISTLKYSLIIKEENKYNFYNYSNLFIYSFLSFSIRPQILPILFIWITFILFNRKRVSFFFILIIGFLLSRSQYIKVQFFEKMTFHYLESFKTESSENLINNIGFSELMIPSNVYELFIYTPKLFFRFLFSPYPWDFSNLKFTFAYIDALFIMFLFSMIIFFRKKIFNYNILYFSLLFLFVLSIFEIAFTGAIRHRLPFILTLLPLLVFKKSEF